MKLLRLLAAALLALAPTTVDAAQNTYAQPTSGPLTMAAYSAGLNSTLAAIISNNSGATAPAVSGQPSTFQWWVNTGTTPRQLEMYDGAQWVVVGTIDTAGHLWGASASALTLLGSSSGSTVLQPAAAASGTWTFPALTDTVVGLIAAQTLTNKTLTSPIISGGSVDGATVGATTPSSGAFTTVTASTPVGVPSGGSGRSTLTNHGVLVGAGTSAVTQLSAAPAGTLLAGQGTSSDPSFSPTPTLGVAGSTVGSLAMANLTSGTETVQPATGALGSGVATLPAGTYNLAGDSLTQTLTNKSISGASNTLTNIPLSAFTNLGTTTTVLHGNAAGLPSFASVAIGTDVSGLGTGVATWLGTPSSSNLLAAVTGSTGTGGLVFGTSPTIATPVINGLPTGTGIASAATASTVVARDSNANIFANNFVGGLTTTATAAATTTLTGASTSTQVFTGTTTQTVQLPVVSTLALGWPFTVINNSTGAITVQSSGGNTVLVVAAGNTGIFRAVSTSGTTAASWTDAYISSGAGLGTVTSVALTPGSGLSSSGTCSSTSTISCTINAYTNVVWLEQYAGGTGVTDNSTAWGNAMAALPGGGGILELGCGTYGFSHGVSIPSYVSVVGCGGNTTVLNFANDTTVENAINLGQFFSQMWHVAVANSDGTGISTITSGSTSQSLTLDDVAVITTRNSLSCLHIKNTILSSFRDSRLGGCALHGVLTDGTQNTSLSFQNVYPNTTGGDGFHLTNIDYSSLTAAASDSNTGYGFFFENASGVTIEGSGCESNPSGCIYADASTAIGSGATLPDVNSLTVNGLFSYNNGTSGSTPASILEAHSTNSKPVNVILNNAFDQTSPSGASVVMSGTGVVVTNAASTLKGTATPSSGAIYIGAPSVAFTPTITFGGASTGITYSGSTSGKCARNNVGVVTCNVAVVLTNKGTSTGTARIAGFPTAFVGAPSNPVAYYTGMSSITGALSVLCNNGGGNTTCDLFIGGSTGVAGAQDSNFTNSSVLLFTITYLVS